MVALQMDLTNMNNEMSDLHTDGFLIGRVRHEQFGSGSI